MAEAVDAMHGPYAPVPQGEQFVGPGRQIALETSLDLGQAALGGAGTPDGSRQAGNPSGSQGGVYHGRHEAPSGTPPDHGRTAETGEAGKELIGRCDFYDYYLYRHGDHSDERLAATDGVMASIEERLGEDGVKIRLLISELRSNFYEHCVEDIDRYYREGANDPEGDTGHRELVVSREIGTGIIHVDYYDPCPVGSLTYNAYAGPFGQELEPVDEAEAATKEEQLHVEEEDAEDWDGGTEWLLEVIAERAAEQGETVDDALADLEVAEGVLLGSVRKGGTGGRGIPLILQEGLEEGGTVAHSIERFGPDNRGTHLHLIFPPDRPV